MCRANRLIIKILAYGVLPVNVIWLVRSDIKSASEAVQNWWRWCEAGDGGLSGYAGYGGGDMVMVMAVMAKVAI